jgi:hypothetical protein
MIIFYDNTVILHGKFELTAAIYTVHAQIRTGHHPKLSVKRDSNNTSVSLSVQLCRPTKNV